MGNQFTTRQKRKQNGKKKFTIHDDDFIVKHLRNSDPNHRVNVNPNDLCKRHVFISVLGLYQTWRNCPSVILYPALLILPLKTKWIYEPFDAVDLQNEAGLHYLSKLSFCSDITEIEEFIQLLRFKERQGLLFCLLDDFDSQPDQCPLILPVWYHLNQRLTRLHDAVTGTTYNGVQLDTKWWQNKKEFSSKYGVKSSTIMSELYFCAMKFKSIQEIIYQSNPHSLIPVVSYQNNPLETSPSSHASSPSNRNIFDSFDEDETLENWWISDDYDPYAIDNEVLSQ